MAWIARLVEAVNSDNENPAVRCSTLATRTVLTAAPASLAAHAQLALRDIAEAGEQPLNGLRSDTLAAEFAVRTGTPHRNVLVARMTVPGGPWPGHYGLEAVVFDAFDVVMPDWFPALRSRSCLHFAEVVAASNGFARGQGAVLFPELLSLRRPVQRQTFGVVFIDRLTSLYTERVVPVAADLGISAAVGEIAIREVRRVAFLAHEWGHLAGDEAYALSVGARKRRPIAVVSELHADVAGLVMLLRSHRPLAHQAAMVLALDRIVREAWLPRARSQVDSVAARQLLVILRDIGAIPEGPGTPEFRLPDALPELERELDILGETEARCSRGDTGPAERYLTDRGWELATDGYRRDLTGSLSRRLNLAAKDVRRRLGLAEE